MEYQDRYREYLEETVASIDRCREEGRRVVFGYTSNLDIVLRYDTEAFRELGEKYYRSGKKPEVRAKDRIDNLDDFARVTGAYMISGEGGECDINAYEVCQYLEEHFEGVYGLGGTGAQGAAALAALGMPILSHITDRCAQVCERMDYPGLCGVRGGQLVPIRELATKENPLYHMILQFSKGDLVELGGETYEIPCSNRVIMGYDQVHKDLKVEKAFLDYLEAHAGEMVSYNISGLNAILDPVLVQKRMTELDPHFRSVKAQNPDCIVYFESAHYLNPQVKDVVYSAMARYVDILGMNEDELATHTAECGYELDKTSFHDILRGLELVREKHGVKGIVLHTKDYSMYFGNHLEGIEIEKGLAMGNLMAVTRARTARYGNLEDCRESLQTPLSELGLKFWKELQGISSGYEMRLVPSRYMEKPKYTIGLGDTFAAGVQTAFIR